MKWCFQGLVGCQSPAAVAVIEMLDYLLFTVYVCVAILIACCIMMHPACKRVCKCSPYPPPAPQNTIFVISELRTSSQSVQLDDPPPAFPLDEPPPPYEEVVQTCDRF